MKMIKRDSNIVAQDLYLSSYVDDKEDNKKVNILGV